jgi:hypothetical protein
MLYNICYTNIPLIYRNSTVITKVMLFYNTEWQYDYWMVVNYCGKKFYNIGPNVIKLFTAVIYNVRNKLVFVPCKLFRPGLMFAGKAGVYLSAFQVLYSRLVSWPCPTNNKLGWKCLTGQTLYLAFCENS